MQYTVESTEHRVSVVFEGVLNALDLIFMTRDQKYRQALQHCHQVLLDFSEVAGAQLSEQDTAGLAMLGKFDSNMAHGLHLVVVVRSGMSDSVGATVREIFSDSTWQVDIVDSPAQAELTLSLNIK
ncbi:MAG: hypothetical protein GW763_16510 [Paraglaciecola sp.]|nr:hypothetical protein [Paraglaciecola sp.]NCT49554.1 hypothetical protein [Paraglaciecola sp.]